VHHRQAARVSGTSWGQRWRIRCEGMRYSHTDTRMGDAEQPPFMSKANIVNIAHMVQRYMLQRHALDIRTLEDVVDINKTVYRFMQDVAIVNQGRRMHLSDLNHQVMRKLCALYQSILSMDRTHVSVQHPLQSAPTSPVDNTAKQGPPAIATVTTAAAAASLSAVDGATASLRAPDHPEEFMRKVQLVHDARQQLSVTYAPTPAPNSNSYVHTPPNQSHQRPAVQTSLQLRRHDVLINSVHRDWKKWPQRCHLGFTAEEVGVDLSHTVGIHVQRVVIPVDSASTLPCLYMLVHVAGVQGLLAGTGDVARRCMCAVVCEGVHAAPNGRAVAVLGPMHSDSANLPSHSPPLRHVNLAGLTLSLLRPDGQPLAISRDAWVVQALQVYREQPTHVRVCTVAWFGKHELWDGDEVLFVGKQRNAGFRGVVTGWAGERDACHRAHAFTAVVAPEARADCEVDAGSTAFINLDNQWQGEVRNVSLQVAIAMSITTAA
jgi:hypothetical protein